MKTRFSHTFEMNEEEYKAQMETIQSGLSNLTSTLRWLFEAIEREAIRDQEVRLAELAHEAALAGAATDTTGDDHE
jgi:hypothetical protein